MLSYVHANLCGCGCAVGKYVRGMCAVTKCSGKLPNRTRMTVSHFAGRTALRKVSEEECLNQTHSLGKSSGTQNFYVNNINLHAVCMRSEAYVVYPDEKRDGGGTLVPRTLVSLRWDESGLREPAKN